MNQPLKKIFPHLDEKYCPVIGNGFVTRLQAYTDGCCLMCHPDTTCAYRIRLNEEIQKWICGISCEITEMAEKQLNAAGITKNNIMFVKGFVTELPTPSIVDIPLLYSNGARVHYQDIVIYNGEVYQFDGCEWNKLIKA